VPEDGQLLPYKSKSLGREFPAFTFTAKKRTRASLPTCPFKKWYLYEYGSRRTGVSHLCFESKAQKTALSSNPRWDKVNRRHQPIKRNFSSSDCPHNHTWFSVVNEIEILFILALSCLSCSHRRTGTLPPKSFLLLVSSYSQLYWQKSSWRSVGGIISFFPIPIGMNIHA